MLDWGEYLQLAKTLLTADREPREAASRAAASRAYYAALHKSRARVEHVAGETIGGERVHATVINGLKSRAETLETGLMLDRLRGLRAHADYNEQRPFLVGHAEIAVRVAEEVLEALRTHEAGRVVRPHE